MHRSCFLPRIPALGLLASLALALLNSHAGFADEAPTVAKVPIRIEAVPEQTEPFEAELWLQRNRPDGKGEQEHFRLFIPAFYQWSSTKGSVIEYWLEAPGWWSPRTILIADGTGRQETLRIFKTSFLEGKVLFGKEETPSKEIEVRFEQTASMKAETPIPQGTIVCPVENGAFRCAVPLGDLDLRIRSEGFVAHYFWSIKVRKEEPTSLGTFSMERGASIVGFVEDGTTGQPVKGAEVILSTDHFAASRSRTQEARFQQTSLSATTSENGFFQIPGVQPGFFKVEVNKKDQGQAALSGIQVLVAKEHKLPHPLSLFRPATVEARIAPSRDSEDRPWRVSLKSLDQHRGQEFLLLNPQEEDAPWKALGIPSGPYLLTVEDSTGSAWASRVLKLRGQDVQEEILLDFIPVEGLVTLAEAPLPGAEIFFGGRRGTRRIRFETDVDGIYAGLLPEAGSWQVDIESSTPSLRKRFRSVSVPNAPSAPARVDFELSDLTLEGHLVDSSGKPVMGSILLNAIDGIPNQARTDSEGFFKFRGLDPGLHDLQGMAGGSRQTDRLRLEVRKDEPPPFLELTLNDPTVLEGRVISDLGGVPGAMLLGSLFVQGEMASIVSARAQTELDGSFRMPLPVPADAVELQILATGYGYKAARILPRPGQEAVIRLYRESGSLSLLLEDGYDRQNLAADFSLEQNGTSLSLNHLSQWASFYGDTHVTRPKNQVFFPALEFGEYRLCDRRTNPATCSTTFLRPYEEVTLGRNSD
jgi:hypothetical protein